MTPSAAEDFAERFGGARGWRYTGWALMHRVEAWAPTYPQDVALVWADDTHCATSSVVLIRVQGARTWKIPDPRPGVWVVLIPQCDGQPPCELVVDVADLRAALARLEAT